MRLTYQVRSSCGADHNSGVSWKAVKCIATNSDCQDKVKESNFITSGVINVHFCHWVLLVLFVLG